MLVAPADLERFVQAQAPVYEAVRLELVAGRKTTHWMWFIFPQLRMLGRSPTARYFGIEDPAEAARYWRHHILGSRLAECARLVLAVRDRSAHAIFGSPDDLKLCSSMTLFESVAPEQPVFGQVLDRYYQCQRDRATQDAIARAAPVTLSRNL